jgi:hypothetical protein
MIKSDYPKFALGEKLAQEQVDFFNNNGFIHFQSVLGVDEVRRIIDSTEKVQSRWIKEGIKKINGVPIKFGKDENGNDIVHRFPFTSQYSEEIHHFVNSTKIQSLKVLMPEGSRIAENEKDGVVVNHYVNTETSNFRQMGWHTAVEVEGARAHGRGLRDRAVRLSRSRRRPRARPPDLSG